MELLVSRLESTFSVMLIHSIWQGALLVLLLVSVNSVFRLTVKTKHLISTWVLFAFCLTTFVTFILNFFESKETLSLLYSIWPNPWFELHPASSSIIIILWAFGFCCYSLRYLFGLHKIKQIIKRANFDLPEPWMNISHTLQQQFNITQKIIFCHSNEIGSAFLKGLLKPIIVVPTSWINQLSYEEALLILTHEMGHITRKDHWVNVMLCYAEIVFFFNPAVHYIVSRIKLERELCADEFTIEKTKDPIPYASLLIKLEESSIRAPELSIGFLNEKLHLTQRVEKIIGHKRENRFSWKLIFFFSLLTCFATLNSGSVPVQSFSVNPKMANPDVCRLDIFAEKRYYFSTIHSNKKKGNQKSKTFPPDEILNSITDDLVSYSQQDLTKINPESPGSENGRDNSEGISNSSMVVEIEGDIITIHSIEKSSDLVYSITKEESPGKFEMIKQIIMNLDKTNSQIMDNEDEPGTIILQNLETNIN